MELFTSIYPSHLEPLVSSMENDVPALIKDFVSETGAASQRQAIRNRFTALPSDSFITDDERIQKVFSDSELVLENLYKLQTVQDAVAPVPEKIIVSEGEKKTFAYIRRLKKWRNSRTFMVRISLVSQAFGKTNRASSLDDSPCPSFSCQDLYHCSIVSIWR